MNLSLISFISLWLFAAVATLSIAAQNVIFVGMAAWVVLLLKDRRLPRFPSPLGLWWLFAAWALLACFYSPNQAHSFFTWKKWLLAAAAWYVADSLETRRSLKALLGSLLFFSALWCLAYSLITLAKPLAFWMQGHPWPEVAAQWLNDIGWRAGTGSGGYQVMATCSMLLILLYSGLLLSDPSWRKPLVWACLACLGLGLLLTMTRGAWLACALGLAFLLAWKKPVLLLGALGLLAALYFSFPGSPFVGRLKSVMDKDNDSNRERLYMAQAGASIIKEQPWLGVGDSMESFERDGIRVTGNFVVHRSPEAVQWYEAKQVADKEQGHLHSNLLQIAAMYGLPGLLLMLAFFLRLFWQALRAARDRDARGRGLALGFCAALIGWWANGLFEYNFGSFQSSFVLWFLTGLFLASCRLERQYKGAPI